MEASVAWKKKEVKSYLDEAIAGAEASVKRARSDLSRTKARTRAATLREVHRDLFGGSK